MSEHGRSKTQGLRFLLIGVKGKDRVDAVSELFANGTGDDEIRCWFGCRTAQTAGDRHDDGRNYCRSFMAPMAGVVTERKRTNSIHWWASHFAR